MEQVVIFDSDLCDDVQTEVNNWFKEHWNIEVIERHTVAAGQASVHYVIIIYYKQLVS